MSQTKERLHEVITTGNTTSVRSTDNSLEFPKQEYPNIETSAHLSLDNSTQIISTNIPPQFLTIKQLGIWSKSYAFAQPSFQITGNNPLSSDFNKFQTNSIRNHLFIFSNGQKVTLPGLGEYTRLGSYLRYLPSNMITIDAGGFIGKQFSFSTMAQQDIFGAGLRTNYNLTERIQLKTWGQYANSGTSWTSPEYNPLFPHSGIGSSVTIKIKDKSHISGGVEYQYNESKKEWNLESNGSISLKF